MTGVAAIRSSRSAQAIAASPMVAALLLMKASASAGSRRNGGRVPPSQGRSPRRHRAADASAPRSPVPMAPTERTGGTRPRFSASARTERLRPGLVRLT